MPEQTRDEDQTKRAVRRPFEGLPQLRKLHVPAIEPLGNPQPVGEILGTRLEGGAGAGLPQRAETASQIGEHTSGGLVALVRRLREQLGIKGAVSVTHSAPKSENLSWVRFSLLRALGPGFRGRGARPRRASASLMKSSMPNGRPVRACRWN